jgi:DNA segregation ATPase FtsK/SpoIIIE, S-DNA-T family
MLVPDLATLPHLLVAGTSGSGKSMCLHVVITSILTRATPDEVRMVLIDPKKVELAIYTGVPHLITPIITTPAKAAVALAWVVGEVERRYADLARAGFRHVVDFNAAVRAGRLTRPPGCELAYQPYPYLAVVIDGLAALMRNEVTREIETAIASIARLGRPAGVHLVAATEQPRISILGRSAKAYMPARLAFVTSSQADSIAIMDEPGAEQLAGAGDALFRPLFASEPVRLRHAFVSEKEIRDIVVCCRKQAASSSRSSVP